MGVGRNLAGNDVGDRRRRDAGIPTPAHKSKAAKPPEPRGTPCSGRIAALVLGQGHGFIRIADGRKVFFHRSDLREGVSFGEFAVDQTVKFDLFEDPISGPRALQVQRRRPRP